MVSCVFAQNGLKIKTSIPTDQGMKVDVQIKFSEFYLNKNMSSQFTVYTQLNDTASVQTFIVDPVYSFKLSNIPTIQIMWDSVANRLRAQGLIIQDL